jgi:vacuolar-type H+-ATPase subunit C/Vma6
MSVSTYAYVNARIGGMKSFLLKEDDFKGLIESRNLDELVSLLNNTRYKVELSESNVLSLELQLKKSLYSDYLKLINCVEGKPREFVRSMARKFEIETLKSIVKMKYLNVTLPEYLIPFGQIDEALIEKLIKADGALALFEGLRSTDYYEVLKQVVQKNVDAETESEGDEEKDLPYLNALDAYYFNSVKESMNRLGKKDKSMVKRFVGFNIDLTNLLMALRLRGIDAGAESYFIDGGEGLSLKQFKTVLKLGNLSKLPDIMPQRFVELTTEALEKYDLNKSLIWFEVVAKKQILRESKKLFLGDRFHVGTIIAYLNLKENEISNLIKVIKTKDEFFSTKEIEELLVLV